MAGEVRRECPLCQGRTLSSLTRYRDAHLTLCGECGAVFAGRYPADPELAAYYGAYPRDMPDSWITRQRYRELLEKFAPYRETGRILDMGCGVGFFLEEARNAGWEPQGSEFDERTVRLVQAKGIECVAGPVSKEAFAPHSFDVVTAFEVVEHVRDPMAEAEVIAHALRPGGLFYCTTPNFNSISRWLLGSRWSVITYPEHLTYFTPRTLDRWLGHFGLIRVKLETTGVSLTRLQEGIAPPTVGSADPDATARRRIERSPVLRSMKKTVNALLTSARAGDTIKGYFELRTDA